MRKAFFVILLALATASASAGEKVYKTFVRNGRTVYYCQHDGLTVTFDPFANNVFEPVIGISNDRAEEILFEPTHIQVFVYTIPGVHKDYCHKVQDFLRRNGSKELLTTDTMKVLTYKEYRKKISRSTWWANFAASVIDGTANAYMVNSANGAENFMAQHDLEYRSEERNQLRREALQQVDEEYWRTNTIFPATSHFGFVRIKQLPTDNMRVRIPVNGENYDFDITF